jgi:Family of unknown function (DUF6508)
LHHDHNRINVVVRFSHAYKPNTDAKYNRAMVAGEIGDFRVDTSGPHTVFGTWHPDSGTGRASDPWTSGWYGLSKIGTDFHQMIRDAGYLASVRTASEWMASPDGQHFEQNRDWVSTASYEQLARLLAALVRRERWDDECWKDAFESGLLLAVAERAETLLAADQ